MDRNETQEQKGKTVVNAYEQYKQKYSEMINKQKQSKPKYTPYEYTPYQYTPYQSTPNQAVKKEPITEEEFTALYKDALEMYDRAVKGDAEAVKKSIDLFKRLNMNDPQNYVIEAYLGSAISLLGRDLINPNDRMKYSVKGLKLIDHAVASLPDNIEIRNLRANICYKLPETYFHRTGTAIEDYNYIIKHYEDKGDGLTEDQYCHALFQLGSAYKNLNKLKEAQTTWEKLLSVAKDPKYKKLLKAAGVKVPEPVIEEVPETKKENETPAPLTNKVEEGSAKIITSKENSEVPKKKISEALKWHYEASLGNRSSVQKALQFFKEAYEEDPLDAVISAYYADCISLEGRDSNETAVLFGNGIKAIKMLDEAVNMDPDNIEIRLLRANQSYRLPEAFFRRTATAISDFEYIIERYSKDNSIISVELYKTILYMLGKAYKRMNMDKEAKAVWETLKKKDNSLSFVELLKNEEDESLVKCNLPQDLSGVSANDLFLEGRKFHDLVMDGQPKYAQMACEILEKAYEADPENPKVEAYYASSIGLAAKESGETQKLFGSAIKGLKLLNHAVERDPENPEIRFLRASFTNNLPEAFFHMGEKTLQDFEFVASAYESNNRIFSKNLYCQILFNLGTCYERLGNPNEAEKVWRKLMRNTSDEKLISTLVGKIGRSEIE